MDWQCDAVSRRVSRDQPRNGMVVRGGARHAAAERARRVARVPADCARPRAGRRRGLVAATVAGIAIPSRLLKIVVAAMLITLGCYRLWRHRHPRFGGMQVGFRDLTVWSFLMASAHGAGFMVLAVRDVHADRRRQRPAGTRPTRCR